MGLNIYGHVNRIWDPRTRCGMKFLVDNKTHVVQLISAYTFHILQATAQIIDLLFQLRHAINVKKTSEVKTCY